MAMVVESSAALDRPDFDASAARHLSRSKKIAEKTTVGKCAVLPIRCVCSESAAKQWSHLEMVGNSNRVAEFSSEKMTDSLQTESTYPKKVTTQGNSRPWVTDSRGYGTVGIPRSTVGIPTYR